MTRLCMVTWLSSMLLLSQVAYGARIEIEDEGLDVELSAAGLNQACDESVSGAVAKSSGKCSCSQGQFVQCAGQDGGQPGAEFALGAFSGQDCVCTSQDLSTQQSIKTVSCTEDVIDCLYHILPGGLRFHLTNLHKLIGWDMKGTVDYSALPMYYLDASDGKRFEVAHRGNAIVVMSYDAVTQALHDLVKRPGAGVAGELQVSGYSLKGGMDKISELGNMVMNNVGQFYHRFNGIGLGAPAELHDAIRPWLDKIYGTKQDEFARTSTYTGYSGKGEGNYWTDEGITQSAREFLNKASELDYVTHYCYWAMEEYHKIIGVDEELLKTSELGIRNPVTYAHKVCDMQGSILVPSVLPSPIGRMSLSSEAVAWRKMVEKDYERALSKRGVPRDVVEIVAASFMDAHLFAGGLSVPGLIASCVATILQKGTTFKTTYGSGTGTLGKEFSITDFVWEVSRVMSPVHFVPSWYKNEGSGNIFSSSRQKVLACTACAQFDPRIWSEDNRLATEFKVRPTAEYEQKSIGWADVAHNPEKPERDRWCPGKRLSMAITVAWVTAFLEVQSDWQLPPGHVWKGKHLSPYFTDFKLTNKKATPTQGPAYQYCCCKSGPCRSGAVSVDGVTPAKSSNLNGKQVCCKGLGGTCGGLFSNWMSKGYGTSAPDMSYCQKD